MKVVRNRHGNALYFSRWPLPFDRDASSPVQYFKHMGLYAYRRDPLRVFHSLPPSTLELAERLEQLRFLEFGLPIRVAETTLATVGVDTEADLRTVEQILRQRVAA